MDNLVLVNTPSEAVTLVQESIVVTETDNSTIILAGQIGPPGPTGPAGPQGPIGDAAGAFLVTNRFYEIAQDEEAKATARQNLGLQTIDGGTFF